MIITIKNDDGESVYDVSKIEDEQKRNGANISISKIGTLNVMVEALNTLNVMVEALNYASQGHQNNLEAVLKDSPEAIVEQEETETEETTEETSDES
jgi:hypothetical protein